MSLEDGGCVFLRRDGNHLEDDTVRVQKTSSHFLRREMLNRFLLTSRSITAHDLYSYLGGPGFFLGQGPTILTEVGKCQDSTLI
jgi:hypothetical protein